MPELNLNPSVAIACGGTGGHLFPGLAVAEQLQRRDCSVLLLVSPKEVDRQALPDRPGGATVTLPAVALQEGNIFSFISGFIKSYYLARRLFQPRPPQAVLAMGGFISAPTVLAAPAWPATLTFLHEANSIPGRANRWLAPWVNQAFVNFPSARRRLWSGTVNPVGMPVRPQFVPMDPASCRMALGLAPERPVLLVTGGSQGATGINELIERAWPLLQQQVPDLQLLHLTGSHDFTRVKSVSARWPGAIMVRPFLTEMELALGAATVAVSRAGASSLAELAAMRVPAILIPYPAAADNHQFFNALALVETSAAHMVTQKTATPEILGQLIVNLARHPAARSAMASALAQWHHPQAAEQIADQILTMVERRRWGREDRPCHSSEALPPTQVNRAKAPVKT